MPRHRQGSTRHFAGPKPQTHEPEHLNREGCQLASGPSRCASPRHCDTPLHSCTALVSLLWHPQQRAHMWSSRLEAILFSLVEEVCFGRAQVYDLWAPISLHSGAVLSGVDARAKIEAFAATPCECHHCVTLHTLATARTGVTTGEQRALSQTRDGDPDRIFATAAAHVYHNGSSYKVARCCR